MNQTTEKKTCQFRYGSTYFSVFRVVSALMEEGDFVPMESFEDGRHRLGDLRIGRSGSGECWEKFLVGSLVVRTKLIVQRGKRYN